jgi:hypothetical protein
MTDYPPPMDLELEWSLLAQVHAGHLPLDAIDHRDLTEDRALTLARLRAGTVHDWELRVFDLLPSLSVRAIEAGLAMLRDLAHRRRMLTALGRIEAGLRDGSLQVAAARTALLGASNA